MNIKNGENKKNIIIARLVKVAMYLPYYYDDEVWPGYLTALERYFNAKDGALSDAYKNIRMNNKDYFTLCEAIYNRIKKDDLNIQDLFNNNLVKEVSIAPKKVMNL